jgi:hypothetical protein
MSSRRGPRRAAVERAAEAPEVTAAALSVQYQHVKRDLVRIVVLGVSIFVLIYASQYVVPSLLP